MGGEDPYSRYERQLGELHALIRAGKQNSDEAEFIRDSMDAPWRLITPIERMHLRGLSHDLYSLSNEEVDLEFAPPPRDNEERAEFMRRVRVAHEGHQWDELLSFLRPLHQEFAPSMLAYIRGHCWREMGRHLPAAWFFDHAWRVASGAFSV